MGKLVNPMAIKAALTYEVGEAAKALGKSPATIRNWIKDGLPVMTSRKPYLISGFELRAYIKAKQNAAKMALTPNELRCFTCRAGRQPLDGTVTCLPNNLHTFRLMGRCKACEGKAARIIAKRDAPAFAQTFHFKASGTGEAY